MNDTSQAAPNPVPQQDAPPYDDRTGPLAGLTYNDDPKKHCQCKCGREGYLLGIATMLEAAKQMEEALETCCDLEDWRENVMGPARKALQAAIAEAEK